MSSKCGFVFVFFCIQNHSMGRNVFDKIKLFPGGSRRRVEEHRGKERESTKYNNQNQHLFIRNRRFIWF